MADEATENVGGIGIDVVVDDSQVDSDLDALLAKLQEKAQQAQIRVPVGFSEQPAPAATAGRQPRQAAPQPTSISLTGRSGSGKLGSVEEMPEQWQRQIAAALAQGQSPQSAPVVAAAPARQRTDAAREAVAEATTDQAVPVTPELADTEAFVAQFMALMRRLSAQASEELSISPEIDQLAARPRAQAPVTAPVQRQPARQQPVSVTFDPDTLAEQDRRDEVRSGRLMDAIGASRAKAAQPEQTPSERRFLAALVDANAPDREAPVATPAQARTTVALSRDDRRLIELSYQNQAQQQQEIGSIGFAPTRTSGEVQRFREESSRTADVPQRPIGKATRDAELRQNATFAPPVSSFDDEDAVRGRRSGTGSGASPQRKTDEEIRADERRRLTVRQTETAAAGRTLRTQISTIGGAALGGGFRRQEAEAELRAATRIRIRDEKDLAEATKFSQRPEIIANARARAGALGEVSSAQDKLVKSMGAEADALDRVKSFGGVGGAARNLLGIAAAGAAFGLAFKGIDLAIAATGKVLDPVIGRMLGFSNVAGRVTDTLSDQTKAAYGNVQAVVATSQAQAGLAASSARIISPLISEQTAIIAGNKSLSEAVDQFETYQRLRQQGLGGLTTQTGGPLGLGFLGQRSTEQELGRLFQGLPGGASRTAGSGPGFGGVRLEPGQIVNRPNTTVTTTPQQASTNLEVFSNGLKFANEQLTKGGETALKFADASGDAAEVERAAAAARAIGADEFAASLEHGQIGISGLSQSAGEAANQLQRLLQAFNIGFQRPDPALLQAQQAQERQANIRSVGRQAFVATQVQQPAQFALGALAHPNLPVGTGIAQQDRTPAVTQGLAEAQGLQDQLNVKYKAGQDIIENTYRPAILRDFGQAALTVFNDAYKTVAQTGQRIAALQSDLSWEQTNYQVAQYNYQLQIARRSLSDIGGLTGHNFGEGQSYLGMLEKQNLALSRQGQQLQFNLSQRQINFQTAVAGFETPGVTPAERQARVKEAAIEAEYAQKQLDISKQIFGNQVQIVDISNLRQGVDLAKQIGLLVQGRSVTIDVQVKQENITRLEQIQSQATATVGTYIGAVNSLTAAAISDIQKWEATIGHAITTVQVRGALAAYGIGRGLFEGISDGLADYMEQFSQIGTPTTTGSSGGGRHNFASGTLSNTSGPTDITVGEAGNETVAVLRNPRQFLGEGGGGSGGNTYIDIHDNTVRSDADLERIARLVETSMGRKASLIGLRPGG